MRNLGLLQAILIWIIIVLAVAIFVPERVTLVRDNTWWVAGLLLTGLWTWGKLKSRHD